MARVAEADIAVGHRLIGHVQIDPGAITGEGGISNPCLVIPVSIALHARPKEEMLALTRVTAWLYLGDTPGNRVGLRVSEDLTSNMSCRSPVQGQSKSELPLRIPVSVAAVEQLERARQGSPDDTTLFTVQLEGTVAWLARTYGEMPVIEGEQVLHSPFSTQYGLHSELSVFWDTRMVPLRIQIEPSAWVRNVLPGLGRDRQRMIEFTLPPKLPRIGNAAHTFDVAKADFDSKKYADCISKCRGIVGAWNRQLGAGKQKHLAEIVGDECGWPADDERRLLLDAIWQGLVAGTGAAYHPEKQEVPFNPTASDARLYLYMTAIISDYVSETLKS